MKKKILFSVTAFFTVMSSFMFCMKDMSIQTLKGHVYTVVSVKFGPNNFLISRSIEGLEKLWAKNNKSQWVFVQNLPLKKIKKPKTEGVFSLSLKNYVPLDGDKTIRIWEKNFQNKFVLFDILKGHTASVNSVVFVSSGKILVSGSDDTTMKVWIKKWPGRFFLFDTLTGHTAPVNSVAISPDETTFASGASDNTVKIWKNPFYVDPNAQKTEAKKPLS